MKWLLCGLVALGLLVGGAGQVKADLLVASSLAGEEGQVLRYDQNTGAFLGIFIPTNSGGATGDYTGLTIGPDGQLYAAKNLGGFAEPGLVQRHDPASGAFLENFVFPGNGGLIRPGALAFGPDGNLYVRKGTGAGSYMDTILRYDGRTGAFLGVFVPPFEGTAIRAFVFGPDSNLYTANTSGNILRYDGRTGRYLGLFAGGFGGDFEGVVFGPDGNLYVSEARQLNSTIHRFDGVTGAFLGEFVGPGQGGLYDPGDLVFGPDGDLYVANHADPFPDVPFGSNSIKRYDGRTGAFLGDFILPGSGGLGSPTASIFTAPVPEPSTLLLLAIGTLGLIGWAWRRHGQTA